MTLTKHLRNIVVISVIINILGMYYNNDWVKGYSIGVIMGSIVCYIGARLYPENNEENQ